MGLLDRAQADELLYKRELIKCLQRMASAALQNPLNLAGDLDAVMRRKTREDLLEAVDAVLEERGQQLAPRAVPFKRRMIKAWQLVVAQLLLGVL